MPIGQPDLSPLASLPAPDEHCAADSVEIALLKRERFADPQSGAPEHDDQRAEPVTVGAVSDGAHDFCSEAAGRGWSFLFGQGTSVALAVGFA